MQLDLHVDLPAIGAGTLPKDFPHLWNLCLVWSQQERICLTLQRIDVGGLPIGVLHSVKKRGKRHGGGNVGEDSRAISD